MKLTPEQKLIEWAKLDGFTFKDESWRYPNDEDWQKYLAVYRGDGFIGLHKPNFPCVPRYPESYDAAIPLIQKQPLEIRAKMFASGTVSIMTTAAQLCDELLKAHGFDV